MADVAKDVRSLLFLGLRLQVPFCSGIRVEKDSLSGSRNMDREIEWIVGFVSGVAINHPRGKSLQATYANLIEVSERHVFTRACLHFLFMLDF